MFTFKLLTNLDLKDPTLVFTPHITRSLSGQSGLLISSQRLHILSKSYKSESLVQYVYCKGCRKAVLKRNLNITKSENTSDTFSLSIHQLPQLYNKNVSDMFLNITKHSQGTFKLPHYQHKHTFGGAFSWVGPRRWDFDMGIVPYTNYAGFTKTQKLPG